MFKKIIGIFFCSFILMAFGGSTKKVQVLTGLTASMPKDFVVMIDDDIAQRYPTHKKPLAMYTNPAKTIDFGVNFAVNRWNNKNLTVLKDMYKSTISSVFSEVEYMQDGVIKEINDKQYIVFEFDSRLTNDMRPDNNSNTEKNYTYIMYTLIDQKILIFNLTCNAKEKYAAANIANSIMASIVFAPGFKIDGYKPVELEIPKNKPKATDNQMKLLENMKNNRAKKQE